MVICQITQKIPNTVNKGTLYMYILFNIHRTLKIIQHNGLGGDKCDVLSETFIYADVNEMYDVNVGIGIGIHFW